MAAHLEIYQVFPPDGDWRWALVVDGTYTVVSSPIPTQQAANDQLKLLRKALRNRGIKTVQPEIKK